MVRMMICILATVAISMVCVEAQATGARQHSVAMRNGGTLGHAQGRTENVAYLGDAGLFPRVQAHIVWRRSGPHRNNLGIGPLHLLPMGRVAVARDGMGGAYVTGRKLFQH